MSEKIVKFEKPTEETVKDNLYLLEEMIDSMEASIENAKKVYAEQAALVDVLKDYQSTENYEGKHDFSKFIEEIASQSDDINKQVDILTHRTATLKAAVETAKSNEDTKAVVNMLLDGLGVFNRG